MNVLDLFLGIGGFSLGLERAGMRTVAFCEIDPFCRATLAHHWAGVPCHDDITTREFRSGEADVVCGGFPCQDISYAGDGAGLAGARSGLWRELLRAIRVVRPRFAIVENVAALLDRGMGTVLGDLASIGNDAEWHCIPASALGAPHERDRVWIIAHADKNGLRAPGPNEAKAAPTAILDGDFIEAARVEGWRSVISDVGSAVYGFPGVVDRLRPLGNAVTPYIPEAIGRAIMKFAATKTLEAVK